MPFPKLLPVVSVWSAYGHRFIGTDAPEHESCLTCGAMYVLVNLGGGRGEYTATNGAEPMPCTGDTSMAHGYETSSICNCVCCA